MDSNKMITLTKGVLNPAFIEEAYIHTGERSADGGYKVEVNGVKYWSPTEVAVVIHYASGRISVYGGDDANTIWIALHGSPVYVDSEPCKVIEGHGIRVKVREVITKGKKWVQHTYDWSSAVTMKTKDLAVALLNLLVDHGYVNPDVLEGIGADKVVDFVDGGLCILSKRGWTGPKLIIPYTSY